jgi:hypothetical protein
LVIKEGLTPVLFEDLPKGTYIVREVIPEGYEATGPTEYEFIILDKHLFHKYTFDPFVLPEPVLYRNQQIVNRKTIKGFSPSGRLEKIPSWNVPGRPKNPKLGMIGFNLQTNNLEIWNGSDWIKLPMKKV